MNIQKDFRIWKMSPISWYTPWIFQDGWGSATLGMGVYRRGLGAAFSCSMKLWHLEKQEFLPAQVWWGMFSIYGDCGLKLQFVFHSTRLLLQLATVLTCCCLARTRGFWKFLLLAVCVFEWLKGWSGWSLVWRRKRVSPIWAPVSCVSNNGGLRTRTLGLGHVKMSRIQDTWHRQMTDYGFKQLLLYFTAWLTDSLTAHWCRTCDCDSMTCSWDFIISNHIIWSNHVLLGCVALIWIWICESGWSVKLPNRFHLMCYWCRSKSQILEFRSFSCWYESNIDNDNIIF